MKKRLLKAMPHIPIVELRPELPEQDEENDDSDDPGIPQDTTDQNNQSSNGANTEETEANTTFHDLEVHMAAKYGLLQRVKRFVFWKKGRVRSRKYAAVRSGLVTPEDDNFRYGDDESSDNEGDLQDEIPLVRRNYRN